MAADTTIPGPLKIAAEAVAAPGELDAFWPLLAAARAETGDDGLACEQALARAGLRPKISWALAETLLDAGASHHLRAMYRQRLADAW